MEKYYPYSVKEILTECFGEHAVNEMRVRSESWNKDFAHLTAHAWAYADEHALNYFEYRFFLADTVLCDDYIAYIVQFREKRYAYLSFIHFEDKLPFDLDPEYAFSLCGQWREKGYDVVIMRTCIEVIDHKDSFSFRMHSSCETGTDFLIPAKVDSSHIFHKDIHPFWLHVYTRLVSAASGGTRKNYECLFSEKAALFRSYRSIEDDRLDSDESRELIAGGIDEIKAYFENAAPLSVIWLKHRDSCCYDFYPISGDRIYSFYIDGTNQIEKLIEYRIDPADTLIPVPEEKLPKAISGIEAKWVRALDVETVRAYALQAGFSNGSIKNYYMRGVDTVNIPDKIEVDGFVFDESVLGSVRLVSDENGKAAVFSNGFRIAEHILYHRGYSQLEPEKFDDVVFGKNGIKLRGVYRTPLKNSFWNSAYEEFADDEYWGANHALVDEDGSRLSDYSGRYIYTLTKGPSIYKTKTEYGEKIGYLKADGSWLVPPIFDKAEEYEFDHCVSAEIGEQKYLVNELGEIIPFEYKINTSCFSSGLCEFSAKEHKGDFTYPEEDYFDELRPGLWGFIDKFGKIVVEPQYVFTTGFRFIENRAFVAKIIEGETLWGLIDEKGNEIIPCIYPNLSTHMGNAVSFQRERNGNYGLMDFDGNVIMEPRYAFIKDYNSERGIIAAGHRWGEYGAAKINDGQVIVPFIYESVWLDEGSIECETQYGTDVTYDYEGRRLGDPVFKYTGEETDFTYKEKEGKYYLLDDEGNIALPFSFDEKEYIRYYKQGYLVTGTKGRVGLSEVNGREILPPEYSKIRLDHGFIVASYGKVKYTMARDKLFLTDGTLVYDGIYRIEYIGDDFLTMSTPLGWEKYRIERS